MGKFVKDYLTSPEQSGLLGVAGRYSGIFGDDPSGPRTDYPYLAATDLYDWSSEQRKKYPYEPAKPYEGELSAPMTGIETGAQDLLQQYMGSGTPSSLTAANKYTTDVLQGAYDPTSSPYYIAMKKQMLKDAEQAGTAVRQSAATRGMLHSDPRRVEERKTSENFADQINTLLGSMFEAERGRMGQAAGMSPSLAGAMTNIPQQKITTGATVGAIPRQVEQSGLDRMLGEFKRQTAGAGEAYDVLGDLSGKTYSPFPQDYNTQSTGQDMSKLIMKMLPLLLNFIPGGQAAAIPAAAATAAL